MLDKYTTFFKLGLKWNGRDIYKATTCFESLRNQSDICLNGNRASTADTRLVRNTWQKLFVMNWDCYSGVLVNISNDQRYVNPILYKYQIHMDAYRIWCRLWINYTPRLLTISHVYYLMFLCTLVQKRLAKVFTAQKLRKVQLLNNAPWMIS